MEGFPTTPESTETTLTQIRSKFESFTQLDTTSVPEKVKTEYRTISSSIDSEIIEFLSNDQEDSAEVRELQDLSKKLQQKAIELLTTMFARDIGLSDYQCPPGNFEEVSKQANYNGDITSVFLDRMQNPEISAQLHRLVFLSKTYDLYDQEPTTRESVRTNLTEVLRDISTSTPITFTGEMPSGSRLDGVRENIDIKWKPACRSNDEYGVIQKSYTEAHEKGHTLRKVRGPAVKRYLSNAFDFGAITISPENLALLKQNYLNQGEDISQISDADIILSVVEYLKDPMELIERMGQLKNYFGMTAAEPFTKEHLEYARQHYILDTKNDNHMTEFFQMITPQTEQSFLTIINNFGI